MKFANRLLFAALPIVLVGASASAVTSSPDSASDPMRFFDGKTESLSTIKLIMRKPYRSKTLGTGKIDSGVLKLVQRVQEDGKAPYQRLWKIRQVAPGRFSGSMSEATGPILVEQVGERYRFRFKMKGNLSIEQWLIPMPGGTTAQSKLSIRKYGMIVGRSEGTIRKI
ncbi:MAG TPA: hypothetical protein VL553_00070 [Sphingomicrobium sp.]|jgi:hypothetical protein|nr:hypothetical protein [Sphingomicrobium sp.]